MIFSFGSRYRARALHRATKIFVVVTCIGFCACHNLKVIEKKGSIDSFARVHAAIPVPADEVIRLIHLRVYAPDFFVPRDVKPRYEGDSRGLLHAAPWGSQAFPMYRVRNQAAAANPWLKPYVELTMESREGDLYLNYGGTWWA